MIVNNKILTEIIQTPEDQRDTSGSVKNLSGSCKPEEFQSEFRHPKVIKTLRGLPKTFRSLADPESVYLNVMRRPKVRGTLRGQSKTFRGLTDPKVFKHT